MGEAKINAEKKLEKVRQTMRYSDAELTLINQSFADNEDFLMLWRRYFLQGELNEVEQFQIKNSQPELIKILRRTLLPEIEPESPLFQSTDLWISIDTKNRTVEGTVLDMEARQIVIDYLEDRFRYIQDASSAGAQLSSLMYFRGKEPTKAYIEIQARNTILSHIDLQFNSLKVLAGQTNESPEEIKQRLAKNSNK